MLSISLKNRFVITLDDDPLVSPIIEQALDVTSIAFSSTEDLLKHSLPTNPLAVFVDLHLNDSKSGFDAIPALRTRFPFTPIIVITSNQTDEALSESLASGADDFIRKPLSLKEVTARLQRRLGELVKQEAADIVKVGDITINRSFKQIKGHGKKTSLSPLATRVLEVLIEAKGTAVTRQRIKTQAWDGKAITDNALDRKIHEIRQALLETSRCLKISAIYGSGFILEVRDESNST